MADVAPLPEPEPWRWEPGTRPVVPARGDSWPAPVPAPDRTDERRSDPYRTRLPDFRSVVDRPSWHSRAACRGMGPSVFFPELGQPGSDAAREVCASCEVQAPCASAAHANGEHGIWAGLSRGQRRKLGALLRSQDDDQ